MVVEVPIPVYPPRQLLEDCNNPEFKGKVYSDLVSHIIDQDESLRLCSLDKKALREWTLNKGVKDGKEANKD